MMLTLVYPPRKFSDLLIIRVHKIVFFHEGGSGRVLPTAELMLGWGLGESKIICLLPDLC